MNISTFYISQKIIGLFEKVILSINYIVLFTNFVFFLSKHECFCKVFSRSCQSMFFIKQEELS